MAVTAMDVPTIGLVRAAKQAYGKVMGLGGFGGVCGRVPDAGPCLMTEPSDTALVIEIISDPSTRHGFYGHGCAVNCPSEGRQASS